jgi:RNA polymerase sigma-70 factor (ECF subfamily)
MISAQSIERLFRQEYGKAVAVLIRFCGSIDLAEEAVQDAFTIALQRWPTAGLPPSPVGWLITTARNRVIDHLRREASRDERQFAAALLEERDEETLVADRLRLIFTCCHPALALHRFRPPSMPFTAARSPPPPPTGATLSSCTINCFASHPHRWPH